MINLTPHSIEHPLEVSEEEYDQFVKKSESGWSHSEGHLEFLSKHHYLRWGFKTGKIEEQAFLKLEEKLVLSWWNRGT